MATISKTLTISEAGNYNFDISLWTATINVTTTSSKFYGKSVSVTTPSGSDSVKFSDAGSISYKVHETGAYIFSITYGGTTYSTTVEVTAETTYSATLDLWQATVNISTTSSEFYGGTIAITSSVLSEPAIATFSSSGSATYIAGKAGTYNFAITYGGKTYEKSLEVTSQTTYSVELNTLKIVGWSSATDEELVAMVGALDSGEITTDDLPWAVGDERVVQLNEIEAGDYNEYHPEQSSIFIIMDIRDYNGVGHYIVGFKNCIKHNSERMELTGTNGNGWHGSRGKKCCDAIFNMIPSSINPIFKTFTVYSASYGGSNTPGITAASSKMSLFSEKEVFGYKSYSTTSEIDDNRILQIKYYKASENRIKYLNGVDGDIASWVERSPSYRTNKHFCYTNNAGKPSDNNASYTSPLAPFMVI